MRNEISEGQVQLAESQDSVADTDTGERGQTSVANTGHSKRSPLSDLCDQIRYFHRQRCYMMEQRKRLDLSLGSFLRLQLGWSPDLTDAERRQINKRAQTLIKYGEAEYADKSTSEDPDYLEWKNLILASIAARDPFDTIESTATKAMEKLAKQLPVYAWAEGIKGFGDLSLATIVAEAGDLSNYPKKGHLWKRLGLAVIGGVRQGGLSKGSSADAWIEHGYSKLRRSRMWNIGESLIKKDSPSNPYRPLFLERCRIEHENAVAQGLIPATTMKSTVESWATRWLPDLVKITDGALKKNPGAYRTAGHMTKRAQRYMEKTLLRDLWREWRRASLEVSTTSDRLPAADHSDESSKSTLPNGHPAHDNHHMPL